MQLSSPEYQLSLDIDFSEHLDSIAVYPALYLPQVAKLATLIAPEFTECLSRKSDRGEIIMSQNPATISYTGALFELGKDEQPTQFCFEKKELANMARRTYPQDKAESRNIDDLRVESLVKVANHLAVSLEKNGAIVLVDGNC